MHGVYFIACWFTANFYTVTTEKVPENHEGPNLSEVEENIAVRDHHTFVALIDIVFMDTSKRTCTGTIIHDYVVITAGHCFIKETTSPELTLSFIVIGTKKMFDSDYEQYLPIEKYKIHSQFKGWTADLALVYTFAAMTSDKPGKALHLAYDKPTNTLDSTVTVLSWGKASDKYKYGPMKIYSKKVPETTTRHCDDTDEDTHCKITPESHDDGDERNPTQMRGSVTRDIVKTKSRNSKRRYEVDQRKLPDPIKSRYTNWRRKMGTLQNNLTVETFSFINLQSCRRLVELVMPPLYDIKDGNDVVCYSSDGYVITDEDAGAPAVRGGRLFAVTVGGVDVEGEQVAVGMRLSCFCSWIAANLPYGGSTLRCCKDCCEPRPLHTTQSRTRKTLYV